MPTVLIAAGGTGGHIIPALTIAKSMRCAGLNIHWVGSGTAIERTFMEGKNIPQDTIQVSGLRDRNLLMWLSAPLMLARASWQAWRLIRRVRPIGVLGMGGYVSGPIGVVAWLCRLPLLIHEQNATLGWSNRLLLPFATRILTAFSGVCTDKRAVLLGNPVAEELLSLPEPAQRYAKRNGPLRLLVLGGSQGAHDLNRIIPHSLKAFTSSDIKIWHQSGAIDCEQVARTYSSYRLTADVSEFITDMSRAYGWADLVVCRAGALTLAELAAVGVAAVLVPLTGVAGNHQIHNAHAMTSRDAMLSMSAADIQSGKLGTLLKRALEDRSLLLRMAQAAYVLRVENATERVVAECQRNFHV